jgi:hypothetical protein
MRLITTTFFRRPIDMETALALASPPELMLAEEENTQLSGLVEAKLAETQTLTVVTTDEAFESAGKELLAIAQLRTKLEAALRPYIEFWHRGHKAHTQLLATLDGPLDARERSMKQGLARYQREKEEARRREEERLRKEAEELRRKLEDEDRDRREKEAEAERRRQEEEALAEAARREAEGDSETAELILEQAIQESGCKPAVVPQPSVVLLAPVLRREVPKVRGVGFREVPKWGMKCRHERADNLNCEVCRSVPREYLLLDPKRVQARVSTFGTSANIPGIEVWMDCTTSVRRKV